MLPLYGFFRCGEFAGLLDSAHHRCVQPSIAPPARANSRLARNRRAGSVDKRRKHGFVHLNNRRVSVDADPGTPLLWAIRDRRIDRHQIRLRRRPVRRLHGPHRRQGRARLQTQVSAVEGKMVVTIEGLSPNSSHPLQKAWIAEEVPQCGYCQSGQIMQAAELLAKAPTDPPADRRAHGRQHLPLRHLSPHHRRHRARIEGGLSHDNSNQGSFPPRRARGLGGMSFCLAFGTDGLRVVSQAQANTMANAQINPGCGSPRTAP